MQTGRKWIAVAMALALLLMQLPMALAADVAASAEAAEATEATEEADVTASATSAEAEPVLPFKAHVGDEDIAAAVASGRELSTEITAYWHSPMLLDDETNSLIASLLDAIQLRSSHAVTDTETTYSVSELLLSGSSAIRMEAIAIGEQVFINSPILSNPVAIAGADEILQYFQNLFDYMSESGLIDSEVSAQLSAAFTQQADMTAQADIDALVDSLDLAPLTDALTAWFDDIATGEAYDGDIASMLDAEAVTATLYQVTKDDIVSLLETALPLVRENTAFWRFVLENADTDMPTNEAGEPMTIDEMIALLQEEMDVDMIVASLDEIPDDITLYYAECFDATGAASTNIIHMAVPNDEGDTPLFEAYAEWLPDCSRIHIELLDEYIDGFTVDVVKGAAEAEGMTDQLTAVLSIISSGETAMQFVADAVWGEAETGDGLQEKNASLLLGMVDAYSGSETGVMFDFYRGKELIDADVYALSELTASLVMADMEIPLLTVDVYQQTGEPTGMPFDPQQLAEDVGFVYPGQMDAGQYAQWLEGSVTPGALQAALSVVSLLPPDVFAWFMTETGLMESMY